MRLPAILCGLLGLFLSACAGTVDRRVATDEADIVTGTGLQSMDIKAMATKMAADIKASGVLAPKQGAERASFYIHELDNQSSDRIDKVIILEAIQTEIAKAMGRTVKILDRSVVANQQAGQERDLKDAGEVSGKNFAKVAGADFFLHGTIRSRDRQAGNLKSSYIVVTFKLTDMVEQEMVWTNNYDIKSESEKSVINR